MTNDKRIVAGMLTGSDFYGANVVYSTDGIAPTITTTHPGIGMYKIEVRTMRTIRWPTNNSRGYIQAYEGDGLVMARPTKARGTVQEQIAPTLTTGKGCDTGTVTREREGNMDERLRIRFLTPRESLRLMGQDEQSIDRLMEAVPSKTAQYRLAGNSIVVDVLVAIFDGIYNKDSFKEPEPKQCSLGRWTE